MSDALPIRSSGHRPDPGGCVQRLPPVTDSTLSAANLRSAFEVAEGWLLTNRDGINAINVYPVPDGDTGTNMLLTLRAALRGIEDDGRNELGVGEMTRQMARAALLGARGNSGVILSQMIRGFAEAFDGTTHATHTDLIMAVTNASDTAYAAVSNPVEGTMLTVLREAATHAREHLQADSDGEAVLLTMVDEAYASVERTPDLLPRLREAGVVDAGGAGVAVILDGIVRHLCGTPLPEAPRYAGTEQVQTDAVEHEGHGYCTEFIVLGEGIDLAAIERGLTEAGGDSLLVVGEHTTVHVHVHMDDPGPALSIGARAGALSQVKVENMQAQHEVWMAGQDAISPPGMKNQPVAGFEDQAVGLVAIASGAGIAAAFRDLGAGAVIELERGTKASAAEILAAARQAGRSHAIVLPNDGDILMAAEAAAQASEGFITVIPSRNIATGLAAAVCYRPGTSREDLAEEMTAALHDVHCIEVSTAVRDATVDGISVRHGEAIALVNGRMHGAAATHDDALIEALASGVAEGASLVTVYLGTDAGGDAGARIEHRIAESFPAIEVEVLPGGQLHYAYIASVE